MHAGRWGTQPCPRASLSMFIHRHVRSNNASPTNSRSSLRAQAVPFFLRLCTRIRIGAYLSVESSRGLIADCSPYTISQFHRQTIAVAPQVACKQTIHLNAPRIGQHQTRLQRTKLSIFQADDPNATVLSSCLNPTLPNHCANESHVVLVRELGAVQREC